MLAGCARWLPPGRPQIHVGPMLRALVATPLRVREATSRFLAYGRAVEAMRAAAVPEPHWYLAGIGVEPGRAAHGHRQRADAARARGRPTRDGVPCALLTNTEANLAFYERHGFEVVREGETPDGRAARLDDAAQARTSSRLAPMAPKRFPDRDEIAAVRAEAEALEPGERGPGRAPPRRPRPRAPRAWGS